MGPTKNCLKIEYLQIFVVHVSASSYDAAAGYALARWWKLSGGCPCSG